MYVFLNTRTIVKTYGPVGLPMVMVSEGTDQMKKNGYTTSPQQLARTVFNRLAPQGSQRYFWRGHNIIVLHKVTRQRPQTTTVEEKEEPK